MSTAPYAKRLDSWKEIAEYLHKDVRTVIRWEKEKGLPVRRLPGGKRQSVFALTSEIDAWAERLGAHEESVRAHDPSAERAAVEAETAAAPAPVRARRIPWIAASLGAVAIIAVALFALRAPRPAAPSSATPDRVVEFNTAAGKLRYTRLEVDAGIRPYRLVAADLNADGNMDLAFSGAASGVMGILLGVGDGTFLPARVVEGCVHSDDLVVADFNRDGHLDIATACFHGNEVQILWGAGDGSFPSHTAVPVPGNPRFLAVADLNGDGWPDLIVSSFGEARLYQVQNHEGDFSRTPLRAFEGTAVVVVADLEGNGGVDLIASVRENGRFGLAFFKAAKNGSMRFVRFEPWDAAVQDMAHSLRVADIDGDGTLDIVCSLFNGLVLIRKGRGRGEFLDETVLAGVPRAQGGRSLALADLNLDGEPDLLITDPSSEGLLLLVGMGRGEFAGPVTVPVGRSILPLVVADFNNDHLPDIVLNPYFDRPVLLKAAWGREVRRGAN